MAWRLAAHSAPIGIFRARAARRGVFVEINPAGRALLPHLPAAEGAQPALADLFSDPAEYEQIFQTLLTDGEVHESHPPRRDQRRQPPVSSPSRRAWCAMSATTRLTLMGCWRMSPQPASRRRGVKR